MTTTTTKQPRHAAESFLPIYAATRAQHALRRQVGPIDGDAFATARKTVGVGADIDLWELVAERDAQDAPRHEAPTAPIAAPEEEKRGVLAEVLQRWRWRATLTQLAIAEPRVEAPTSEVAR